MPSDWLSRPAAFRRALLGWFAAHGRDHPWRRTQDPYAILVSEVMLQQTRVATVLERGYFTRFLKQFPHAASLASADDSTLLRAWEGLGYYRRARMLRDTARVVVRERNGEFPTEIDDLAALPGIGRYTAAAVRSFAFDLPAVVIDGNVARLLARLFDFRDPIDTPAATRQLTAWAGRLSDPKHPRAFNSALMELGQLVCKPGRPACDECPVRRGCRATDPRALPQRKRRPPPAAVEEHAVFVRRPNGGVLLEQTQGGRRDGFWQLPLRSAAEIDGLPRILLTRYPITRFVVTLHVHAAPVDHPAARPTPCRGAWHTPAALAALPIAAPFRRALDSLLANHPPSADIPPAPPAPQSVPQSCD